MDTGAISPKDIELFQFADTPEQAFELLKQGLTENYLAAEAATLTAAHPENQKRGAHEDLMAGWNMEDFLGPESRQDAISSEASGETGCGSKFGLSLQPRKLQLRLLNPASGPRKFLSTPADDDLEFAVLSAQAQMRLQ